LTKEKTYIEPVMKMMDDRFEAENLSQYRLFILAGPVRLHFCVVDAESNRCLALESYTVETDINSSLYAEKLAKIIENHPFLPARFWKSIHICVANDKFTLIPLSLFKEENSLNYLQLNCEVDSENNQITYFKHQQAGIANVFAFDSRYFEWVRAFYTERSVHFMHQTSPLIEAILRQPSADSKTSMMVSVGYEYMTILVKEQSNLKFCNKFFFKTDEDFLYYLMLVVDELTISPNTAIELYGELHAKSNLYLLLKKHFPNIRFGKRPPTLQFGYVFDEIAEHNYFDLMAMIYCVQ